MSDGGSATAAAMGQWGRLDKRGRDVGGKEGARDAHGVVLMDVHLLPWRCLRKSH